MEKKEEEKNTIQPLAYGALTAYALIAALEYSGFVLLTQNHQGGDFNLLGQLAIINAIKFGLVYTVANKLPSGKHKTHELLTGLTLGLVDAFIGSNYILAILAVASGNY